MAKDYVETTYSSGALLKSTDLNKLNTRNKNSFRLLGKTLSNIFEDNKVIDSGDTNLDSVIFYDGSGTSYTDYTEYANRNQEPYFPDVAVTTADVLYVGFRDKFDGLNLVMGSPASSTINPTFKYYNGAWTAVVSASDNTSGFTDDNVIFWATSSMTDWQKEDLNTILSVSNVDSSERFWVKITQGNNEAWGIKEVKRSNPTNNELKVSAVTSPGMYVNIGEGFGLVNKRLVSNDSEKQIPISAPSSNLRYTIIQIDQDGTIDTKNGTAAASPTIPATDSNNIKLAEVITSAGTTQITTSLITDTREFTQIPKNRYDTFQYFTNGDTTPNVSNGENWKTGNSVVTTITDFDGGSNGQEIFVVFGDSNTVVVGVNSAGDWYPTTNDSLYCKKEFDYWICNVSDNTP